MIDFFLVAGKWLLIIFLTLIVMVAAAIYGVKFSDWRESRPRVKKILSNLNKKNWDTLGPLTGYRAWGVDASRGMLKAVYGHHNEVIWPHDGMVAKCVRHTSKGTCPDKNHSCGIYAYEQPRWGSLVIPGLRSAMAFVGTVKMSGIVWPHEYGYRAEKAKPDVIYQTWDAQFNEQAKAILAPYNVTIEEPPTGLQNAIDFAMNELYMTQWTPLHSYSQHSLSPYVPRQMGSREVRQWYDKTRKQIVTEIWVDNQLLSTQREPLYSGI